MLSTNIFVLMKTLVSLFDYSGHWAEPFAGNGWDIIQLDLKHGDDIKEFQSVEDVFDFGIEECHGILAAPPCTHIAGSGAQFWKAKDEDGRTAEAIELFRQVERFADLFTPTDIDYEEPFFWVMENPVGRIGTLFPEMGKPYYFNPHEFAGQLNPCGNVLKRLSQIREKNGIGVTKEENNFVITNEAYTKKTGLWDLFNKDLIKKNIEPVKCSPQGSFTQRIGGSSDKTKEERSYTPLGFAKAFYEANHSWTGYLKEIWNDQES